MTYYIIRSPNAIIAIHRVYDSAAACFQQLMNSGAIDAMEMWALSTNDYGIKIVEWVLHTYVREQPGNHAAVHHEEQIAPLPVPAHTVSSAPNTPGPLPS